MKATGFPGLSSKKSSGRIARHNNVNDLIFRARGRAGVPCVKEPAGLLRNDGKRPDGISQIPWAAGKCLAWDVTITDTLAPSYIHLSALSAGKAAERAAENKVAKYTGLSDSFSFIPLAFETLGPMRRPCHF